MVKRVAAYLSRQSLSATMCCAMTIVALIGFLDRVTGYEAKVGVFYVAPVSLAAWYAGRSFGIIVAIVSGIASLVADSAAA